MKEKRDKPKNSLLTIENKVIGTRGELGGGMGEMGERGLRVHLFDKHKQYTKLFSYHIVHLELVYHFIITILK